MTHTPSVWSNFNNKCNLRSAAHLSAKQSYRIQTGLVPQTSSYSKINHYRKPSILFKWLTVSHVSLQLHKLSPSPLIILTTELLLGSLIQQQFQTCFMYKVGRDLYHDIAV